jgi:hypothetical protein
VTVHCGGRDRHGLGYESFERSKRLWSIRVGGTAGGIIPA